MVFYVDGAPAVEKKETHRERYEKRVKALKSAEVAVETLSDRVRQGKSSTMQMFKNVEKGLREAFRWSLQDREDFVEFLQGQQLDARLCRTEAYVAIAADCQPQDIVFSQDSDYFAYDSVKTYWRPMGKRNEIRVLEYTRAAVLTQSGLTTTKLTALACVSSNDQNKNIPSLGIVTNYSIIKDLPDADVPCLVKTYHESPRVVCTHHSGIDFTASILVFTTMSQEIAASTEPSSLLTLSSGPATPLPASPLLCHKYKLVKDQHAKAKAQKRQGNLSSNSDAKPNRQGKHREFRRYRVIDRPAHEPGVSRQVHRPRYSYKARPVPQQQEQPSICTQYRWKPYTSEQVARYRKSIAEAWKNEVDRKRQQEARRLEKEPAKKAAPKIDDMNKMRLINAMMWEHPLVSLTIGTVNATVSGCILDAVGQARTTKRQAQEFLGAFIEVVFERGPTEDDRTILSSLCPAVKSKLSVAPRPGQDGEGGSSNSASTPAEDEGEEDAEDDSDEDVKPSVMDMPYIAFYQILLAHIYSRKFRSKTVAKQQVSQLLARAASLGVTLPPVPPRSVSYPTKELLESTTKQIYRSIKKMYRDGSITLEKKLPAIENYLILNKASGELRRIAPLSPLAACYVSFSERQLLPLFWHWPTLKHKIRRMMVKDRYFQDPTIVLTQVNALNWLSTTTPGRLITTLCKHSKGFHRSTVIMDLDGKDGKEGLREHIRCLRAEAFDPKEWRGKGYVIKGSIQTDGRLLQPLAFKVKELQSVRYRRVLKDKLPNPLVTTIGGTNSFLTEARNIFKTAADVESLLTADPSQVAVVSLDLGVSCIVCATVSLPPGQTPVSLTRSYGEGDENKKRKKTRRGKRKTGDRKRRRARREARDMAEQPEAAQYFDLVVRRKAVSQPTGSFSSWLESQKGNTTRPSGRTIRDLESALPPLNGEGASFRGYVAVRRACESEMDSLYNNTNYWKHRWDAQVGRQEEFYKVADGLLRMIGG
ncbi:hypothetical protein BGZ98_000089 [Dissophora globulifera]|nr:hypothetical protein BGZ98_000089 [Dissophora globulifera]